MGDLENGAVIIGAAFICRAKEVAGGVENELAVGVFSIGRVEVNERGDGACAVHDLEDSALTIGPAGVSDPKQISGRVENDAAIWIVAVGVVENGESGNAAGSFQDFKDTSVEGWTAGGSCVKQISAGIEGNGTRGPLAGGGIEGCKRGDGSRPAYDFKNRAAAEEGGAKQIAAGIRG